MAASADFDLVVRGGTVYDGTGATGVTGDVAVRDGVIVAVGRVPGRGTEEIDARGRLVTPGFVDVHTHYDGQVVWSDRLTPSSWHGVTTAVMGNCGVGFAPCRPEDRDALVALMEGVEDIPAAVMHEGLPWQWETFEEYLDVVAGTPRDIDVCALVPHAPIRVFVMGERALRLEPATAADVEQMRSIVAEAVRAGAFGVSTSRTVAHRNRAGDLTPTLLARESEIVGLTQGLADAGRGVFEVVGELSDAEVVGEFEMIRRALRRSGRPGLFSLLQSGSQPDKDKWRELMAFADDAIAEGVSLRPVVAPRSISLLLGLEGSQHPFSGTETYADMAHLGLPDRLTALRDPDVRARILQEDPTEYSTFPLMSRISYSNMFRFGDPPNYVPAQSESLAAIAGRQGRTPAEVAYDVLLERDGMGFIYVPFANFASGDLSVCEEMLSNPNAIMGLGDGGAHVGFILDAGFPTWLLTYWVRDQRRFSVAEGVRRLTSDTADSVGLTDRGRIAVGLRADLNVIDLDALTFSGPFVGYDLPAGGKRLLQTATGYVATIVAGEITYRDGVATGARPGRLVRSGEVG
ncbi:amidohydrolase (plasmid) [Mycolicibacterium madagascariense]|uniref:Amidohydrolase n=1 Tax=Mycolicibacterium madagascariense TaxID=212765 RepID=A0A7I7XPS1_9MYCO|nr:amidohydrolase family protein [Mycolicibacterium madagascariense]BBZ31238.1 amidohydrolase [Mycolicibacterium madagascariense]